MAPHSVPFLSLVTIGIGLGIGSVEAAVRPSAEPRPTTEASSPAGRSLIEQVLGAGSGFLISLGALTTLGLAATFMLAESLKEDQIMPRHFWLRLRRMLTAGRLDQAVQACQRNRSAIALVLLPAIQYRRRARAVDAAVLKDIMEGELHRQAARVSRRVRYLRDIGDLAPAIGVFGAGLVWLTTFADAGLDPARAQPATLTAGLTGAWTTAGAGLLVGTCALLAHALFRGQVTYWRASLIHASADVFRILVRRGGS
jgi:biopolymer transport protein ExbB/TolQ